MRALVLSGGGARGAYQVGVLKTIAEICEKEGCPNPFDIYNGMSAGALNVIKVAQYSHSFWESAQELEQLWSQVLPEQIYRTQLSQLGKIGLSYLSGFKRHKIWSNFGPASLLDTQPLRKLIEQEFSPSQIDQNLLKNAYKAIVISAFNYTQDYLVHFIQSLQEPPQWNRRLKKSRWGRLTLSHIMASSAIPILFPPERIENDWYGDGCLRNYSPSAPAIYLGANRILLVGVKNREVEDAIASGQVDAHPSFALVLDAMVKSLLLDPFEYDLERLERINQLVEKCPQAQQTYKKVQFLSIVPSQNIGELALTYAKKLPRALQFLLKALGPEVHTQSLMSYLLFDSEFTKALIDLGYYDSQKQKDAIYQLIRP